MVNDSNGLAVIRRAVSCFPAGSKWSRRLKVALNGATGVGVHLGVFVDPFLEAILDGRKTLESRFGLNRSSPFERVYRGDIIFLKQSGGPVVGLALAGDVSYHNLTPMVLGEIRDRFAKQLYAEDNDFWTARAHKRFASLIQIDDMVEIDTMPVAKRDRRGWVTYIQGKEPCLELSD